VDDFFFPARPCYVYRYTCSAPLPCPASLMAQWLRCPPEPRPACKLSARTAVQATSVGSSALSAGSQLQLRTTCRRGVSGASAVQCVSIAPDPSPRARRDDSRRQRKIAHTIRVVSVRHHHDALGTPTVRPTVTVTGPSAWIWTPRCPIDAPRRLASQPQKVRHGTPRRIYAQHLTNDTSRPDGNRARREQDFNQTLKQAEYKSPRGARKPAAMHTVARLRPCSGPGHALTSSVLATTTWVKRTRTAADGDMHEASSKNSDGTHHVMIGEPIQRATVSFSRRTGGDVDSKTTACQLETTADSAVHEGGLQAEP
jgi:hypothetical protein